MIEVLCSASAASDGFCADIEVAVAATLAAEARRADVSVRIVDADEIRVLNRDFRHVDAVTDVLTFPAWEGETLLSPPDDYLGDIAICYPRAVEQAAAFGHSLRRELCFLAVHGALHLCGYDHIEPGDEARMRDKQTEILHHMRLER